MTTHWLEFLHHRRLEYPQGLNGQIAPPASVSRRSKEEGALATNEVGNHDEDGDTQGPEHFQPLGGVGTLLFDASYDSKISVSVPRAA